MKFQIRSVCKAAVVILVLLVFCMQGTSSRVVPSRAAYTATLSTAQQQKLEEYAQAAVRYFTSPAANNLDTSFTHAFFGTGRFRECTPTCHEVAWDLTRGYGSHVNINEVTLRFLSLAAAYKMGWLDYMPANERYAASWGQILTGLQTLRAMQTSGDDMQFEDGHFHRTYLTTIERGGVYDLDRTVTETVRPSGEDIQSSDDNALPFMNLMVLEGLVNDPAVAIEAGDRTQIVDLCRDIRGAIDLAGFVNDQNEIVHNFEGTSPSSGTWDRLSAEGSIILAAMLLSGQITLEQFYQIAPSLENYPVDCPAVPGGENIQIGQPSYHAAMFIHGLRAIHGMPVTPEEHPGVTYFVTSTLPTFRAHVDFTEPYTYAALGSQVMTQVFEGTPVFEVDGTQVQFAGNEDCTVPVPGESLSVATGPHAWFIPLLRWSHLDQTEIDLLFAWMADYEAEFFHSGSDVQLGWEAAIPWAPDDTTYTWVASDMSLKYTDWGRPFEALNAAYTVLSIFDALNPDAPLASYNVKAEEVKYIAAYFDSGDPLVSITKSAETDIDLCAQQQITYTVALTNHVGSLANILFTDTLPISTTFGHWIEQPGGAVVTGPEPEITWSGPITASEPITFTFFVTRPSSSCDTVCNIATYDYVGYTGSDSACFEPCAFYEPVKANFSVWPTCGTAPLTVTFTNNSVGNYCTSFWEFGDGGNSIMSNPAHTYTTTGTYTVALTVSGIGGSDVLTRTNFVDAEHCRAHLPLVLRE